MKNLIFGTFLFLTSLGQAFAEDCKHLESVKVVSLYGSDSLSLAAENFTAKLTGKYTAAHYSRGSELVYPLRKYLADDNKDLEITLYTASNVCEADIEELKMSLKALDYTDKKISYLKEESISTEEGKETILKGFDVQVLLGQSFSL